MLPITINRAWRVVTDLPKIASLVDNNPITQKPGHAQIDPNVQNVSSSLANGVWSLHLYKNTSSRQQHAKMNGNYDETFIDFHPKIWFSSSEKITLQQQKTSIVKRRGRVKCIFEGRGNMFITKPKLKLTFQLSNGKLGKSPPTINK